MESVDGIGCILGISNIPSTSCHPGVPVKYVLLAVLDGQ